MRKYATCAEMFRSLWRCCSLCCRKESNHVYSYPESSVQMGASKTTVERTTSIEAACEATASCTRSMSPWSTERGR